MHATNGRVHFSNECWHKHYPERRNILQVIGKVLVIFAFAAMSAAAQSPEAAESRLFERVYLAKDDGAGKPGQEASEFNITDIPIHCVVELSNSASVTVKMDLVVVSVAGVRPETKVVSANYTTRDLQNQVYFHGKPKGLWIAGTYRADIYVDGNLVGKFPFNIKGSSSPIKPAMNFQPKQPKQPVRPRSATAKRT